MTPQSDVALAPLTTMGVGGAARWFVDARSESDVRAALRWASDRGVSVHVIGGGSNVIVADRGIDGLVIRVAIAGMQLDTPGGRVVRCRAGGGEPWDSVVGETVRANLAGLECLSGIPGSAGATPVQNVGAYGQDVAGTITEVSLVDRLTGESLRWSGAECGFGYRTSRLKRADLDRYVVTRVDFALVQGGAPTLRYADVVAYFEQRGESAPSLAAVREAVLTIRRRKGMVVEAGNPANRSCGSFFVNPVVSRADYDRVQAVAGDAVPHFAVGDLAVKIPAAWLIERAGFPRGTPRGTVGISPFQAQAILNLGGAQAADVVNLACEVKRAVHDRFGVTLTPEPVCLGFAPADLRGLLGDRETRS